MVDDATIRAPSATPKQTLTEVALGREHTARTATALRLMAIGTGSCGALIQLVVHKPPLHWVITGLLLFLTLLASALSLWTRADRPVPPLASLCIGLTLSTTALLAVAYLGVISSTVLILGPVLYAYANTSWEVESFAVLGLIAIGYAVLAVLSLLGVLPLTGSVLALQKENVRALVGLTLLAELVFGLIFWIAWRARRTMLAAVSEVAEMRLEAERRGALLAEAREDLRQAVDAGRLGRLSGRMIDGHSMGEVIGRGAMGEVYAATRVETGEPVAIKVLHPHLMDKSEDVERFLREMRITAALESPHVVRVLGTGTTAEGSPYLAMEWLVGSDLAALLRDQGRIPLRETVELVRQVAEALAAARDAGVVHRDVKPQNLFRVDTEGRALWKVLDFGVSRFADLTSSLTQGAIGTPSYMAPEQCRGEPLDHRADVFALAVVAYRVLTGRPPFSAPDHYSVIFNIVNEQPVCPSELAMLPGDVDLVLALALAKDRQRRFDSAPEFAAALQAAAHNALPERLRERARVLLSEHPWQGPEGVSKVGIAEPATA